MQQTLLRLNRQPFASPVILCRREHRFTALRQARECGRDDVTLILEPEPRNTAASALLAALHCRLHHGDAAPMLLLPADQTLEPPDALADAMREAPLPPSAGTICTFGIPPTEPRADLGYLLADPASTPGPYRIRRFVEKPDTERAARMLAADAPVFWNAGIFLATAGDLIAAFERHAPSWLEPCREALRRGRAEPPFLHLNARAWRDCPEGQFDRVIMERHDAIACVPLPATWNDLGTWPALYAALEKDENGNVTRGETCLSDTRDSIALSLDGRGLALLGLSDVIAVAMRDMVLLASMERADEVASLARRCALQRLPPTRGERPWGDYVCLTRGDGYQIKLLRVSPGARLSLQRHARRTEHWIVLSGRVRVWKDGTRRDVGPGDGVGIPAGTWHRLENPDAARPAEVLEIQCGDYLGEDDIERSEDDYGRC